jgi:SAM-dependent methyltransferase
VIALFGVFVLIIFWRESDAKSEAITLSVEHKHHRHEAGTGHHHDHSRHGAKQPEVFDPARAALLDDPQRFVHLPPELIFTLLDAPRNGTVVDFGTGTGTFAIELAGQRPDLKVIALDEQPAMLELLKKKLRANQPGNLQPLLSDKIDSIRGMADRVLAINVLHEVGDEVLREMSQLLTPQGSILIVDWDAAVDRPVGPPKGHTHTMAEARSRLVDAGLAVESLQPLRYHFALRARRSDGNQQNHGR